MMSTPIRTQVLVLGSGPGGYSAAFRCSDLGKHTTIVERYSNLGGVCLNVGCIPSKTLLHVAKLIQTSKNFDKYGIYLKEVHIDINKIRTWKNTIITRLAYDLQSIAGKRKVKIVNGFGKFLNNHTLQVINNQTTIDIVFDYAIIASGSHSISLPLEIPQDERVWDSTDALKIKLVPERLLIVGSGAIGLEIATIYHALGTKKIDVVEMCNQIIPILDNDIIHNYTTIISKKINFILNTTIHEIHTKKDGIYVVMKNEVTSKYINNRYDALLIAIGRAPNGNTIGLENTEVHVNKNGFIKVDKQMRTNVEHIFAIGDIVSDPMLAHKSIYEGHIAAEVISGKKRYFDTKIIPSIIYTDPEIAWVGCTEKSAKKNNINYKTACFPWKAAGKAITSDYNIGITKLIFDKDTHRIIGGTVLGTNASEILGEIALAIEMGCDVEDISLTIHAHPTLYETTALAASIYNESITDLLHMK